MHILFLSPQVETAGHVCDICGQVSKTRHAFAMHKKRKHKVNLANEPLPDTPRAKKDDVVAAANAVATAGGVETTVEQVVIQPQ